MGNKPSDADFTNNDLENNNPSKSQQNLLPVHSSPSFPLLLTPPPSPLLASVSLSSTPCTPMKGLPLPPFPSTTISANRMRFTQRLVSDGLSELAASFWRDTIEPSSLQERLEIACSLWFGMLSDSSIKALAPARGTSTNKKLETVALKILDMIGFIVRAVYTANVDLPILLQQLGEFHTKMGVKIEYYRIMLHQLNVTFRYYYPQQYSEIVELAITEVFVYSTQLMTGEDIKIVPPLNDLSFLISLRRCIRHPIGKEYIFKYLNHVYCDEMMVFLYLLNGYKSTKNERKRYLIAQYINKLCISADGCFAVNISYDYRQRILKKMDAMDENMSMDIDFFVDIEDQVCRLIMQSHWKRFKSHMNEMHLIE